MNNYDKSERGQAIVIIALGIVVLMGFVALSIDGGMIYSDRRNMQNAADASSLAAGGTVALELENEHIWYNDFDCNDMGTIRSAAVSTAQNRAGSNGFNNPTVTTSCEDGSGSTSLFAEKYIDVQTEIITQTDTAFVHFVFDNVVQNYVQAITRIKPRQPAVFGHAIVALNDEDSCDNNSKDGVVFSGNGLTAVNGGGVFSNGCLKGTNNSCEVEITNGGINYGGGRFPATGDMCQTMTPSASFSSEKMPEEAYDIPIPDCSKTGAVTVSSIGANTDLNAAYPNASLICVTSSNNAIKISNGYLRGSGFTIYLPNGGDIEISGGEIDLSAPGAIPDPDPGIEGVLIYVNPTQSSVVQLNGNSETNFLGLIYAPGADVTFNGTNGTAPTFNTQVVGWNVEISGGATIDINYNDSWVYSKPSRIDLQE